MEYDHCEQNDFNDETSITIEEAMFEYEMTEMFVQEMDDSITSNSDDEVHVPESCQSMNIEEAMFEYEMTEMFGQEMDDIITSNSDDEVHVPETYQIMKKKDIIIKSDSNSDIISNEKIKKNKKNYKREKKNKKLGSVNEIETSHNNDGINSVVTTSKNVSSKLVKNNSENSSNVSLNKQSLLSQGTDDSSPDSYEYEMDEFNNTSKCSVAYDMIEYMMRRLLDHKSVNSIVLNSDDKANVPAIDKSIETKNILIKSESRKGFDTEEDIIKFTKESKKKGTEKEHNIIEKENNNEVDQTVGTPSKNELSTFTKKQSNILLNESFQIPFTFSHGIFSLPSKPYLQIYPSFLKIRPSMHQGNIPISTLIDPSKTILSNMTQRLDLSLLLNSDDYILEINIIGFEAEISQEKVLDLLDPHLPIDNNNDICNSSVIQNESSTHLSNLDQTSLLEIVRMDDQSKIKLQIFLRRQTIQILLVGNNTNIHSDFSISRSSLSSLFGYENQYISGEIIDYFGLFLSNNLNLRFSKGGSKRLLHVFSNQFYTKLSHMDERYV